MKQHHKTADASQSGHHDHEDHGDHHHDHAQGHDHGHAHHHGHAHTHTHAHGDALPAVVAEPVGWSLLRASLAERLLVAAGFTALAWVLIGMALA